MTPHTREADTFTREERRELVRKAARRGAVRVTEIISAGKRADETFDEIATAVSLDLVPEPPCVEIPSRDGHTTYFVTFEDGAYRCSSLRPPRELSSLAHQSLTDLIRWANDVQWKIVDDDTLRQLLALKDGGVAVGEPVGYVNYYGENSGWGSVYGTAIAAKRACNGDVLAIESAVPLYRHPAPATVVTEAMVERAFAAFNESVGLCMKLDTSMRKAMRAALEAR